MVYAWNVVMALKVVPKCTYNYEKNERVLKCLECEGSQYILSEEGKCNSCFSLFCEKSHYENNT